MSLRLYRDGLQIERFYSEELGDFSDDIAGMLRFAIPNHSDHLQHCDCREQLLGGVDGQFLRLFGSLNNIKRQIDPSGFEELSLVICKAYYLLKQEDYDAFAEAVHEMEAKLATAARRTKVANDG